MKKIIKNTMTDPIKQTCPYCQSIFTYTFEDIEVREESSLLGISIYKRRYVRCPVCKEDIALDCPPKVILNKEEADK